MSPNPLSTALKAAALSLGLLLQVPAQAGLISGSWDPEFGSALPGLSWAAYAEVLVPNNDCTDQAGPQTVAIEDLGKCAGATLQAVFLRLYNTNITGSSPLEKRLPPDWSQPSTYFSSTPDVAAFSICDISLNNNPAYTTRCPLDRNYRIGAFNLTKLRIENGNVAGLEGGVIPQFTTAFDSEDISINLPTSAERNLFSLSFTLDGPELWCETCLGGRVKSESEGLRQFLVTYESDDTSRPKFKDSNGNALGVVLDQDGNVLGRSTSINGQLVPEPAGLALVLTALGAAALVRRRR